MENTKQRFKVEDSGNAQEREVAWVYVYIDFCSYVLIGEVG